MFLNICISYLLIFNLYFFDNILLDRRSENNMHVSNFFTIPNNIYIIWQFVFIHMHFLFCWHSIVRFLWHSFRYLSSYRAFHLKNNSKMYQTFLITSISNPVFYYCFYMYKIRAELFLVFLDLYVTFTPNKFSHHIITYLNE